MFLNNSINHEYTSLNNSYNDVESKICRFLNAEANHSQSLNKSMNLNQSLQLVDNSAKSKLFPLKCFRKSNPKLGISSSKRYSVNTESTSPSIRRLRASASIYNTSRDRFDPLTRIRENLNSCSIDQRNKITIRRKESTRYNQSINENPNVFKKSKGMCADFLDHSAKHSFIANPFKR